MQAITAQRAGDRVGAIRRRGRRLHTYSLPIGGGLVANVVDDELVSFGLEPVGPVVSASAQPHVHDETSLRRVAAWAGPIAGVAAVGATVATGIVLRHRHAA